MFVTARVRSPRKDHVFTLFVQRGRGVPQSLVLGLFSASDHMSFRGEGMETVNGYPSHWFQALSREGVPQSGQGSHPPPPPDRTHLRQDASRVVRLLRPCKGTFLLQFDWSLIVLWSFSLSLPLLLVVNRRIRLDWEDRIVDNFSRVFRRRFGYRSGCRRSVRGSRVPAGARREERWEALPHRRPVLQGRGHHREGTVQPLIHGHSNVRLIRGTLRMYSVISIFGSFCF